MQSVHPSKGLHNSHQSHYKTVPGGSVQPHLMYDYRMQPTIPTPNPIYIQQAQQQVAEQQQQQQVQQIMQQQQQHNYGIH